MSPEQAKEMLDNFLRRDKEAVDELNSWGNIGIEQRLHFTDGRLRDVCGICVELLKHIAGEQP